MWTEITRPQYDRPGRRYASDVTDAEWSYIEPVLAPPKPGGRPRTTRLRDVSGAILYMASTGCQWRMLPNDFPPVSTAREAMGREAGPAAGVIGSQRVKTTKSGSIRGYDAGKKIKGRKRHIVTGTTGLRAGLAVCGADIQDRDGAPGVLNSIRHAFAWLRHIFADGGYAGPKLSGAPGKTGQWSLQIIKRSGTAKGFGVLPRRWVAERTFAWPGRCRRLAKDREETIASAKTWLLAAHICRVIRLLART